MIYLRLRGRIGNQLFMYAFAKRLQMQRNRNEKIFIDDSEVISMNWVNSLKGYNLDDVIYSSRKFSFFSHMSLLQKIKYINYRQNINKKSFREKFEYELKHEKNFNKHGLFLCENGYINMDFETSPNCFVEGYFQCEKYFFPFSQQICAQLELLSDAMKSGFEGIEQIQHRNSVCISIKVEHNVGSDLYDVCSKSYWEEAIKIITEKVENPLFFVCSDNVEYVKSNLIDCDKYDVITQDLSLSVNISLQIMSMCKHFIIGNTSFGWWAQYMSSNNHKIVVAPSTWMLVDMPIDIYQDNWTLVNVEK